MSLTLKQKIRAAARTADRCIHQGDTLRVEKKGCCGTVEIFVCAKRKREVWHTKCKTCESFEANTSDE